MSESPASAFVTARQIQRDRGALARACWRSARRRRTAARSHRPGSGRARFPTPARFVVKNGSNTLPTRSGGMPTPRVAQRDRHMFAGRRVRHLRDLHCATMISNRPPSGIASRAFTAMFSKAISSSLGSASISHTSASIRGLQRDVAAQRRAQHSRQCAAARRAGPAPADRPAGDGRTTATAGSAPRRARPPAGCCQPASRALPGRRFASSALPMITASRLLKSCATPPVSWPIASIFCAWRSCASSCSRSVRSRAVVMM